MDDEIWTGDAPTSHRGVQILGTPLGHADFVASHADRRIAEEERFLLKVARLPDLQCAWLLLTFCGVPRANHLLRVLPPTVVAPYAARHDDIIWSCFCRLLACERSESDELARKVASLPARMGGLGLRSAVRTSPAAFWAAWVDNAPILVEKALRVRELFLHELTAAAPTECIKAFQASEVVLYGDGCLDMPT